MYRISQISNCAMHVHKLSFVNVGQQLQFSIATSKQINKCYQKINRPKDKDLIG